MNDLPAQALARKFHETYERLAPQFGYETRKDTRELDLSTPNGLLMTAVCAEMLNVLFPENNGRPPLPDPKTEDGEHYYSDLIWGGIMGVYASKDPKYAGQKGIRVDLQMASTNRMPLEIARMAHPDMPTEILTQEYLDQIAVEVMAERAESMFAARANGDEFLGTQSVALDHLTILPRKHATFQVATSGGDEPVQVEPDKFTHGDSIHGDSND